MTKNRITITNHDDESVYQRMFHKLVGFIYLVAFFSLYIQFRGLYGVNGILPVSLLIYNVRLYFESKNSKDFFYKFPCLAIYATDIGIDVDAFCEAMLLFGIMFSLLIVCGYRSSLLFIFNWIFYLSLVTVGQTFMSFQWDSLLLECGFLCIFSSNLLGGVISPHKSLVFNWCYRFLAFKLMFSAGVVKVQALCPTWEQLSALEFHFATQPLANPCSWASHQLPPIILRISVAATLLIEIPIAILLIFPLTKLRRISVVFNLILQVVIAMSGNYNFFNCLTAVLMIPVWESDNLSTEPIVSKKESDNLSPESIVNENKSDNPSIKSIVNENKSNNAPIEPIVHKNRWRSINNQIQSLSAVIFIAISITQMFRWDQKVMFT